MDSFEVLFMLIDRTIKSNIIFYLKENQESTLQQLINALPEEKTFVTKNVWELYNHHLIKKIAMG